MDEWPDSYKSTEESNVFLQEDYDISNDASREIQVSGAVDQADEQSKKRKHLTFRGILTDVVKTIIYAIIIAIILQTFFLKAFAIPTPSMEPTLMVGDHILIDRASYHLKSPSRFDIVVFRFDPNDEKNWTRGGNFVTKSIDLLGETLGLTHRETVYYVKRIIALPGEVVEMKEGTVYIDETPLEETHKHIRDMKDFEPRKVPERCVFVMGDNRPNSNDSRLWGFVPHDAIIGKVLMVWWPPSRLSFVD